MTSTTSDKPAWNWKGLAAAACVVGAGGLGYLAYRQYRKHETSGTDPLGTSSATSSSQRPTDPQAKAVQLKNAGNDHFKHGRYEEAIKLYTQAIAEFPAAAKQDVAMCYQNRAAAYEKLEDFDKVIEDCTSALAQNPKYIKAYLRRGKSKERQGHYRDALYDLTATAFLEKFENVPTMQEADRVLKALAESQAKQIFEMRGDRGIPISTTYVEAYLSSFCEDPILSTNKKAANGHVENGFEEKLSGMDLALQCLADKRYEDVVQACSEEIDRHGSRELEARMIRVTFYLIQGVPKVTSEFDVIFEMLNRLPADDTYTKKLKVNAYIKRGSHCMQRGQRDEALADFDLAEQTDPNNADTYHHRGQLLFLLDEKERAKEDFKRCAKLRPDFSLARIQLCYAEYISAIESQNTLLLTRAINKFEDTAREFPHCSQGYALLGQVYTERKSYADAAEMFDKALELAPQTASIYVQKGLMEMERTNSAEAGLKLMQKALDVDPNCQMAHETLGSVEMQTGDFDQSIERFEKAIGLARSELELAHVIELKEAAMAQVQIARDFQAELPSMFGR